MSDSRVAGGLERLPWLSDEPMRKAAPPASGRRGDLAAWAVAAVLVVAVVSFWLGSRSPASETVPAPTQPSTTVTVPQPRSAPAPEVRMAPQPEVAPSGEEACQ